MPAMPRLSPPARPALDPASPPLAAVFAPWYGYDASGQCVGGLKSSHWNNDPNMAGVLDVPELAHGERYYCSADPVVIGWQLDAIERAGIQTLFVSWWGWGDANLDGDQDDPVDNSSDTHMNQGIKTLLNRIVDTNRPISVSLIVEPFVTTQTQGALDETCLTAAQRKMVLDRAWQDYYGSPKYDGVWFKWEQHPLLLAFDPMTLTVPIQAGDPISYTIKNWTGVAKGAPHEPGQCETSAPTWDWFFGPPQDPIEGLSRDGVAFVYPRFDEYPLKYPCTDEYQVPGRCGDQDPFPGQGAGYIDWPPRRIDPWLTQCAYLRQWQRLAANREQIHLIVLYGWNMYGEQAYIEPATATAPRPTIGYDYVDTNAGLL